MFTAPDTGQPYADILARAAANPRAAAAAARALPGASDDSDANAAYALGCCLLAWERFAEARRCLLLARQRFGDRASPLLRLHARRALALADLLTDRPTATRPWEELIESYAAIGAQDDAALAAAFLARAWYNRRDLAPLHAIIDRWLPPRAPAAPAARLARGHFLRLRGAARTVEGAYADARGLLNAAVGGFEQAGAPIEAAHCAIDLAWIAILEGDPAAAHERLLAADAVFQRHDLPLRQAICAHNISIEQLQQGQFAQALARSHRARTLFEDTGRMLDVGSCDMQLGRIYSAIGDWTIASAQFARAREIFADFGAEGRLSSCTYNLALTAISGGRLAEAESLLDQTEREATAWANPEVLQAIPLLRATAARLRGEDGAARAILAAADEPLRGANPLAWARCATDRGWLDLADGDRAAARAWFAAALPAMEQQPLYRWQPLHGLARCAEAAGDPGAALPWYAEACAIVARLRRQIANEHLSSLLFGQVAELVRDALACAVAADDAALVLRFAEQQRTLTLQRLVHRPLAGLPNPDHDRLEAAIGRALAGLEDQPHDQALTAELDATLQQYAQAIWFNRIPGLADADIPGNLLADADLDLAALRAHCAARHGHNWTIVSYTLLDGRLITGVLTPEAVSATAAPWDPAVAALIEQLGSSRSQRRIYHDIEFEMGLAAEDWQPLRRLSATLLPEIVQARLNPDHRLYVVPSGVLHGVPWATLRVGGRWLCECAVVQILPYVRAVSDLGRRQHSGPAAAGNHAAGAALLLGCSEFDGRADSLPHVPAELATVAALWPGPNERWLDEGWTLPVIAAAAEREQFRDYGVIHIASHAYMRNTRGLAGHILVRDGQWWLNRITELRVDGAFVFMSTCDGAVVAAMPGDEHLSLTWSWLAAGASGVVASLWPQYDGGALPLIERFYAAYAGAGDAALALALAQRADLADRERSPIEWGCFVMVGGPRPEGARAVG